MEFSEHYSSYDEPTLLVLTNHNIARVFLADDRTVTEYAVLEKNSELSYDDDEQRSNLYKGLDKILRKALEKSDIIILCAPEAFKEDLVKELSEEVLEAAGDIVSKNLASLEIEQVVRILNESSI